MRASRNQTRPVAVVWICARAWRRSGKGRGGGVARCTNSAPVSAGPVVLLIARAKLYFTHSPTAPPRFPTLSARCGQSQRRIAWVFCTLFASRVRAREREIMRLRPAHTPLPGGRGLAGAVLAVVIAGLVGSAVAVQPQCAVSTMPAPRLAWAIAMSSLG